MHTVELLEQAIALAAQAGFVVRQDWFGGSAAGACQVKGRPWLFIDLSLSPPEQLDQVVEALQTLPNLDTRGISSQMQRLLNLRKAA